MLDKSHKPVKKKTAFDAWWALQPLKLRQSQDVDFARRCFRAGHQVGSRPPKSKYAFKTGKFVVSVWAASATEARKAAEIELDFRVVSGGGIPPKAGWKLTAVKTGNA